MQQGFFSDTNWMTAVRVNQWQKLASIMPRRKVREVCTDLFSGKLQLGNVFNTGSLHNKSPIIPTVN